MAELRLFGTEWPIGTPRRCDCFGGAAHMASGAKMGQPSEIHMAIG